MLDVYSDMTQQAAVFGNHFALLERCELHALREAVDETAIAAKVSEFKRVFVVADECEASELRRAAQTSVALDALVAKYRLGSLAYCILGPRRPGAFRHCRGQGGPGAGAGLPR